MNKPAVKYVTPKDTAPCWCGSGMTFSICCRDHLLGFACGGLVKELWKQAKWPETLVAARADLTQYTIWHKTNTEPRVPGGNPGVLELLSVDIAALGEMTGDICTLYHRLDREAELPAVLESLRSNINDSRWQRKVTYYQALAASVNSRAAGATEFHKLGPITADEKDVELLQAYLDLCRDEVTFSRRVEVRDQIIRLSEKVSDHLQYGLIKSFSYGEVGDVQMACRELAVAIAYARMEEQRKPMGLRARHLFSGVLMMHALYSRNEDQFREAERIVNELLAESDAWSPGGSAGLHSELGELYRYWGKWSEGEKAYRDALAIEPTGISSVFLAECLWQQNRTDEAAKVLDAVEYQALDHSGKVDYAYTQASIAVEAADRARLTEALKTLKSIRGGAPYFEERRLNFIIEVQSAIASGPSSGVWENLRSFLRKLNRYMLLQPNWYGIGVNINAMIEDAATPKRGRNTD